MPDIPNLYGGGSLGSISDGEPAHPIPDTLDGLVTTAGKPWPPGDVYLLFRKPAQAAGDQPPYEWLPWVNHTTYTRKHFEWVGEWLLWDVHAAAYVQRSHRWHGFDQRNGYDQTYSPSTGLTGAPALRPYAPPTAAVATAAVATSTPSTRGWPFS